MKCSKNGAICNSHHNGQEIFSNLFLMGEGNPPPCTILYFQQIPKKGKQAGSLLKSTFKKTKQI